MNKFLMVYSFHHRTRIILLAKKKDFHSGSIMSRESDDGTMCIIAVLVLAQTCVAVSGNIQDRMSMAQFQNHFLNLLLNTLRLDNSLILSGRLFHSGASS